MITRDSTNHASPFGEGGSALCDEPKTTAEKETTRLLDRVFGVDWCIVNLARTTSVNAVEF